MKRYFLFLVLMVLFVGAQAQSPPPTVQRIVAGQTTDTIRVKVGAESFMKLAVTSANDTTILSGDSNTLYISGGGGTLIFGNDTVHVGDSADNHDVVIWFTSVADSGGLKWNASTHAMQYYNSGTGLWVDIGTGGSGGSLTYFTESDAGDSSVLAPVTNTWTKLSGSVRVGDSGRARATDLLIAKNADSALLSPKGAGGADNRPIVFYEETGTDSIAPGNMAIDYVYGDETDDGNLDSGLIPKVSTCVLADTTAGGSARAMLSDTTIRLRKSVDYGDVSTDASCNIGIDANAVGTDEIIADGVSASELNATGVEAELEAVLDLSELQGAVTDGQVPNSITVTKADTGNYLGADTVRVLVTNRVDTISQAVVLTGNLDNTANPWADNEVADNITVSSYALLAAPTFTGQITADSIDAAELKCDSFRIGSAQYLPADFANWNTAYGWGNHSGLYQLVGHGDADSLRNYRVSVVAPTDGYIMKFDDNDGTTNDSFYWAADAGGIASVAWANIWPHFNTSYFDTTNVTGDTNIIIKNETIDSTKIKNGTINSNDIEDETITYADIKNSTIGANDISAQGVGSKNISVTAKFTILNFRGDSTVADSACNITNKRLIDSLTGRADDYATAAQANPFSTAIESSEITNGTIDAMDMKVASKFIAVDYYSSDSTVADSILVTNKRLIDSLTGRADDYAAASHNQAASTINSGTLDSARIPEIDPDVIIGDGTNNNLLDSVLAAQRANRSDTAAYAESFDATAMDNPTFNGGGTFYGDVAVANHFSRLNIEKPFCSPPVSWIGDVSATFGSIACDSIPRIIGYQSIDTNFWEDGICYADSFPALWGGGACDSVQKMDSVDSRITWATYADSAVGIHVSVCGFPDGWPHNTGTIKSYWDHGAMRGDSATVCFDGACDSTITRTIPPWKIWMAISGYYNGNATEGTNLFVSNDFVNFHNQVGTAIQDSLVNPIFKYADFMMDSLFAYRWKIGADSYWTYFDIPPDTGIWTDSVVDSVVHNYGAGLICNYKSDPNIFFGADGDLYLIDRALFSFGGLGWTSKAALYVTHSSDGFHWSDVTRVSHLDDWMSPTAVLDTGGIYRYWAVAGSGGWGWRNKDDYAIYTMTNANPTDTLSEATKCMFDYPFKAGTCDSVGAWHIWVTKRGADEYIMLIAYGPGASYGGTAPGTKHFWIAQSFDGINWHVGCAGRPFYSIGLKDRWIDRTGKFDDDEIYRPSGIWLDRSETVLRMYYTAMESTAGVDKYSLSFMDVYFNGNDSCVNIPLTRVPGRPTATTTKLTFDTYVGGVPYLFIDSAYENSAKDTVPILGRAQFDTRIDSLIIEYKSSDGTTTNQKIDSIACIAAKFANIYADSLITGSGTDRASATVSRIAIPFSFSVHAGQEVGCVLFNVWGADDDNANIWVLSATLKGRRR